MVHALAAPGHEVLHHLHDLGRQGHRDVQVAARFEDVAKILDVKGDPEPGVVALFEHPRGLVLHALASRQAAPDRVEHALGIDARLFREGHALGDCRDVDRDDRLVHELRDLSGAAFTDIRALAEQVEDLTDLLVDRLAAAHHDRERPLLRLLLSAAHRGVEHLSALFPDERAHLAGCDRRDRTHVDDDFPRGEAFQKTVRPAEDIADVGGIRKHGDDHVRPDRNVLRRNRRLRPGADDLLHRLLHDIENDDGLSRFEEVLRHGFPHDPEADETNLHERRSLPRQKETLRLPHKFALFQTLSLLQ